MEGRLDIGDTFDMVGSTLDSISLHPEIIEWCFRVLGYPPRIDYELDDDGATYKYVHLIFKNDADPMLFKINYAYKWEPCLAR